MLSGRSTYKENSVDTGKLQRTTGNAVFQAVTKNFPGQVYPPHQNFQQHLMYPYQHQVSRGQSSGTNMNTGHLANPSQLNVIGNHASINHHGYSFYQTSSSSGPNFHQTQKVWRHDPKNYVHPPQNFQNQNSYPQHNFQTSHSTQHQSASYQDQSLNNQASNSSLPRHQETVREYLTYSTTPNQSDVVSPRLFTSPNSFQKSANTNIMAKFPENQHMNSIEAHRSYNRSQGSSSFRLVSQGAPSSQHEYTNVAQKQTIPQRNPYQQPAQRYPTHSQAVGMLPHSNPAPQSHARSPNFHLPSKQPPPPDSTTTNSNHHSSVVTSAPQPTVGIVATTSYQPQLYHSAPATHFNYRDHESKNSTQQVQTTLITSNNSKVSQIDNSEASATKNATTTEFTSSTSLNLDYSESELSSSSQGDVSDCESYTLEPVENSAEGGLEILPNQVYQVMHGISKIRVSGRNVVCTNNSSSEKQVYQVTTHQGDKFSVNPADIKLVRSSSQKTGTTKNLGSSDNKLDKSSAKADADMSQNGSDELAQDDNEKFVHVLLPREEDPESNFWAEVPESSVSPSKNGDVFSVVYEGRIFQVSRANIAQIEIEQISEVVVEAPENVVKKNKFASVFVGGDWHVFPAIKVKESIRKPGTYVVKLTDKNVRVRGDLVKFFEKDKHENPEELSKNTDNSDTTNSTTSSKLDVLEYNVFIEGKFVRLSGRQVRPIQAKPGYYRVLHLTRKYIVHMNLVLPVVWDWEKGEEVVIAPTHFRVLSEQGEYILPAEMVRPDPGSVNVFIVRCDVNQSLRVKSSLMFPMWLNSDTMCVTDVTANDDITLNETDQIDNPDQLRSSPPKKTTFSAKAPTISKPLTRSASFRAPEEFYYKVFKDGRYFQLDNKKVEEVTSLPGFYKVMIEGEWLYHPAYCISRVRKPALRKTLSLEKLTNTSWEESLRRGTERKTSSRPRWRYSFPDESAVTRGGKLNKIRESRQGKDNSEPSEGVKSVISEGLSGTNVLKSEGSAESSALTSVGKTVGRSKTSSSMTNSDVSSVSFTSR